MRFGRIKYLPLVLATAAVSSGACGKSHLPASGENGDASTDAPMDVARIPYDGLPVTEAGPRTPVRAELVTSRVDTMQLMFAAGEMQTSGEPFMQNFAGRNLQDYNRYWIPVDQYLVPVTNGSRLWDAFTDLFGFSSAVESYEYSKYHMNLVANQTGAGVSLANGPLVAALPGATPFDRLQSRVERLLYAAGTDVAGYAMFDGGVPSPDPQGGRNPLNDFGFPGLWPNVMPYRSWDPTMQPDQSVTHSCTSQTGYGGVAFYGNNPVYTYECDYNTLNLPSRTAQIEPVIGPGVLGYTTWKEAIWGIDFTGRLHDSNSNPVTAVKPEDMAAVATQGNKVVAVEPPTSAPGTFIGSTPLEGMWGLLMVEEMDNAGAWLLSSLATADGSTLGGFPSIAAAIQYDYASPLVWFPTAIGVTEDTSPPHSPLQIKYPAVQSLAIQDATSHAVDLAALVQGYSLFFGMTDSRNVAVGQQIGLQAAFDGGVFASDDGLPDGESSPHDRALAVMRTAFVDLDRLHVDPTDDARVVMDTATVSGGSVTRNAAATTTTIGHVVVGLRHLLMGCNAAVSQYGAPDPDPTKDTQGILNSVPLHPAYGQPSFSQHVREVLMNQADFVVGTLSQADGTVANGATFANGTWKPTTDATLLESQGAALRTLVEAWFLSQDTKYRDRARAVATKLFTAFWSEPARMFRGVAGGADDVVMTAERFAWLQQALRETYEGIWVPGDPNLDRPVLESTIARVNKLYLNGWDDLNGNQTVEKPAECLGARMQLGEQALTGEVADVSNGNIVTSGEDREGDCVLNIAFAGKAAVLGTVHFHAP
ncbi:MAG TPA: hypothetical protein VMI75_18985 [Polyangiaceae bacterium]|nr:hypothetical protein [Polyangiaceae bacterium]